MSGSELDSRRTAHSQTDGQPDGDGPHREQPYYELTEGAKTQALRLRGLQHAAAVEWLDAEATLRATEIELIAPMPVPDALPGAGPAGAATSERARDQGSIGIRLPLMAAVIFLITVGGAGLSIYGPAIASLGHRVSEARTAAATMPATGSNPGDDAVTAQSGGAVDAQHSPGSAVPDDFGARVYGRFAAATSGEKTCLARAIYYEARGEGYDGKVAVAQVVLNRARSKKWPDTICGVVHQGEKRGEKCQFSYVCFGGLAQPSGELWDEAQTIAELAIAGRVYLRELEHATHYHTTAVKPVWRQSLQAIATIGSHIFYKEPGGLRTISADAGRYQSAVAAAAVTNSVKPKPTTQASTSAAANGGAAPTPAAANSSDVAPIDADAAGDLAAVRAAALPPAARPTPARGPSSVDGVSSVAGAAPPPRKMAKTTRPKPDADPGFDRGGEDEAPIFRH